MTSSSRQIPKGRRAMNVCQPALDYLRESGVDYEAKPRAHKLIINMSGPKTNSMCTSRLDAGGAPIDRVFMHKIMRAVRHHKEANGMKH